MLHAREVQAIIAPGIVQQLSQGALVAMCNDIATGTISLDGAAAKHLGISRMAVAYHLRKGNDIYAKAISGAVLTEDELLTLQFWYMSNQAEGRREQALTLMALGYSKKGAGQDIRAGAANALKLLAFTRFNHVAQPLLDDAGGKDAEAIAPPTPAQEEAYLRKRAAEMGYKLEKA
jgi:hypothetical protein